MRTYSPHASAAVKGLLQRLADRVPPAEYRRTMQDLGKELTAGRRGVPGADIDGPPDLHQ